MELMSSLLLCALAALVPLTLGILQPYEIKMSDHKRIGKTPGANHPKVILKPDSRFQLTQREHDILSDPKCKHCADCIGTAMSLHPRQHTHIAYSVPDMQEAYANDILDSYHQYKSLRAKRDFEKYQEKSPIYTRNAMRKNKAVTVTKYSSRGQVYALKVKEEDFDGEEQRGVTACRVYRVKKYYPCDVPEGDLMKLFTKKKSKRTKKIRPMKRKKKHSSRSVRTSFTPRPESSHSKGKRLGDTSQVDDSSMTSIEEEMY